MSNIKVENSNEVENKSVFASAEDHAKFTDGWKNFLNSGNARIIRDQDGLRTSPLPSEYHLFYGVARNQAVRGFKADSDGLVNAIKKMKNLNVNNLKKVFGYSLDKELIERVQQIKL